MYEEQTYLAITCITKRERSHQLLNELFAAETESFFNQDKKRAYLTTKKKSKYQAFLDIFPWFHIKFDRADRRFKESNFINEHQFRSALHYFCRDFCESRLMTFLSLCNELANEEEKNAKRGKLVNGMFEIASKKPFSSVVKVYHRMLVTDKETALADLDEFIAITCNESDTILQQVESNVDGRKLQDKIESIDALIVDYFAFEEKTESFHEHQILDNPDMMSEELEPDDHGGSSDDNFDFPPYETSSCCSEDMDDPAIRIGPSVFPPSIHSWPTSPTTDSEDPHVWRSVSSPSIEQRVEDLEDRVETLEGGRVLLPTGKRTREGGDRAHWVRIIPRLLSTKDKWCKPGAVMGVFPNGLGPLNSEARLEKLRGIAVYSVKPDVIEPLPLERSPELYAPVALSGDVPVALSNYRDYKAQDMSRKNLSVYVNLVTGEVFARTCMTVPPCCVKVGTAYGDNTSIDAHKNPSFQNVRGICTTIMHSEFKAPPLLPTVFIRDIPRALEKAARSMSEAFGGGTKSARIRTAKGAKKAQSTAERASATELANQLAAVSLNDLSTSLSGSGDQPDISLTVHESDTGLSLEVRNGYVVVEAVTPNSAAALANVCPGSKIKAVVGFRSDDDIHPNCFASGKFHDGIFVELVDFLFNSPRPLVMRIGR